MARRARSPRRWSAAPAGFARLRHGEQRRVRHETERIVVRRGPDGHRDLPPRHRIEGDEHVCETQRYERGLELMESIQGADAAAGIRDSFDEISPDFGRY